jgi:hypothetical protein
MPPNAHCEPTRALVPELALGVLSGREHAEALEHIASCPDCRQLLDELSELAEELLLLAPTHEPPPGFHARVLERIVPPPARRNRVKRPLVLLAAAVAAAAVAATGTFVALRDDRELAAQYRAALDRVNGEYFEATQLHAADGTRAGKVFGYQGKPSWLLVVVYRNFRDASFSAEIVTTAGRRLPLPGLDVENGSWGGAITTPLKEVALVRLTDDDGNVFEATLPRP